jgi:hypothetical protein
MHVFSGGEQGTLRIAPLIVAGWRLCGGGGIGLIATEEAHHIAVSEFDIQESYHQSVS